MQLLSERVRKLTNYLLVSTNFC